MVVEQALPADVVALLALGAGAFLTVISDGHDGLLGLLARDEKAALWCQSKAILDAFGRVVDVDRPAADKEPALAVVDHNLDELVLHLPVADKAPVIDLVHSKGEVSDLHAEQVQQVGDDVLGRGALGIGLRDLCGEPLVHSSGGRYFGDPVCVLVLVAARAYLADEDGADVALIPCIEYEGVASLDSLPGCLGQVIGLELRCLERVAVLEGDLKLEVQVVHAVALVSDLEGGGPHPKAQDPSLLSNK